MATKTRAKKAARKPVTPAPQPSTSDARPRRLHLPSYRPLRFKRIRHPEKLPGAWRLLRTTALTLWQYKRPFVGILIIYIVLDVLFVQAGGSGLNIGTIKNQLGLGSGSGQLATGFLVFVALFGSSSSSSNPAGGAYQLFLGLIISLATIWTLRQLAGGQRVQLKDAFYQGMYPLVPFVLVLFVVVLELLPMVIGASFFSIVVTNGIAATGLEQVIAAGIFAVLAFISVYMLCSSLFALYIVTLPNMTPFKALKSARQLVRYRRGQVFRKLLYLPVALLVVMAVLMVPAIVYVAPAATWLFFALSLSALIFIHAYLYTLYKALLA